MSPKTLEKLPELSAAEFEATLQKATELHEEGKLIEAHHLYRELLQQQSMNARLLFLKAVVLYQMDRLDEALPFIKKACELDALNPDILNAHGLISRNMRDFDKAKQLFEQVIKLNPKHFEALNNMGLVYVDQGEQDKAAECFKKALAFAPDHQEVMLNLAHALRDGGHQDEAIEYYHRLVEIEPENIRYNYNMAIALHGCAKFKEAIPFLEKVVELNPDEPGAEHLLKATRGDADASDVPDDYIADLFDNYAENFDYHLAALEYRVPKLLAARIPMVVAPKTKQGEWDILDLGCGTGACGLYFNSYSKNLVGVDLSEKMIAKAKSHDVYDELCTEGIDAFFERSNDQFDIIFATDVLVYIGALESFMEQSAKHLKPGGLLAFSTELCTPKEGRHVLRNSGRFAHADPYVLRLGKEQGLRKMINADINVRMGHHEPIPGKLYIFKK